MKFYDINQFGIEVVRLSMKFLQEINFYDTNQFGIEDDKN
ncbi:13624_t:CDS:2 [Entrophospora sp. SA101]|nr:13624_t:CDS:2 [Entrophospora sp. SA101]